MNRLILLKENIGMPQKGRKIYDSFSITKIYLLESVEKSRIRQEKYRRKIALNMAADEMTEDASHVQKTVIINKCLICLNHEDH